MNQEVFDALAANPAYLLSFFAEKLGYLGLMYWVSWLIIRPRPSCRSVYRLKHHFVSVLTATALFAVCSLLFSWPEQSYSHTLYAIVFAVVAAFTVRFSKGNVITNLEADEEAKLVNSKQVKASHLPAQLRHTANAEAIGPQDEKFFQDAMTECNSTDRRAGLWARCFAETDGDENKARARYIKYRVSEMAKLGNDVNSVEESVIATSATLTKALIANPELAAASVDSSGENFVSSMRPESKIFFAVILLAAIFIFGLGISQTRKENLEVTQTVEPPAAPLPATPAVSVQCKLIDDEALARVLGKPVLNLTKVFASGARDLDGDGVDDVFLADTSTDCGSGGCTYLLVTSNNGQQKNAGEVQAKNIESFPYSSNGMKDLKVTWNSGCQSTTVSVLKFDGYRYKVASSYEGVGTCSVDSSSQLVKTLEQTIVLAPLTSSNARQLNREGIVQIRNGQFIEAARSLAEASSLAPQDPEILGNWGYALFMGGDLIRAEQELRKALAIKPNRGSTLNNLGLVLAAQGHQLEATDFFVRYFEVSTNKAIALNQLKAWSTSPESSVALRIAASDALKTTLQQSK